MLLKETTSNSNIIFCIKNPTVKYQFQLHQDNQPIEVSTIEKVTVTCHQGDYIMTGVIGEQWVVNQKKFKTTYIPIIENTIKGEVWANPDSKIKTVNLNSDNQSGKLSLPWGANGTKKEVEYTKEDVLIYDEEGYWYPCKKSAFEETYLVNPSKQKLEKEFQDLIKLTNLKNKSDKLNISEINNSPLPLAPTTKNNKSLR